MRQGVGPVRNRARSLPSLDRGRVLNLPEEVAELFDGRPVAGADEQAFPFLTTDAEGFPHVALVSRAEVTPTRDRTGLLIVLLSSRTRVNLRRTGRCGLVAVEGTTAHYLKLDVVTMEERDDFLGVVLAVHTHTADSLGIPLVPVTFTATKEIAELERWDRAEAVLEWLDHH